LGGGGGQGGKATLEKPQGVWDQGGGGNSDTGKKKFLPHQRQTRKEAINLQIGEKGGGFQRNGNCGVGFGGRQGGREKIRGGGSKRDKWNVYLQRPGKNPNTLVNRLVPRKFGFEGDSRTT